MESWEIDWNLDAWRARNCHRCAKDKSRCPLWREIEYEWVVAYLTDGRITLGIGERMGFQQADPKSDISEWDCSEKEEKCQKSGAVVGDAVCG